MNNIAENTAPDAVQSLTPPAVRETNAAAEKPHRAQNTGSKARPATKKLNLTQKILEIKKQVAGVPMIRIAAKELTEAELNELLAIAPLRNQGGGGGTDRNPFRCASRAPDRRRH